MQGGGNPKPGWYPDPENPSTQRYWDGSKWSSQEKKSQPPGKPPKGSGRGVVATYRGWPMWVQIGLPILVLIIVIGAIAGGGEESDDSSDSGAKQEPATQAKPKPVQESVQDKPAPKPVESKPTVTASQENAVEAAESYLGSSAFSESGLAEQLKFEGFSSADAQYAVTHVSVDWNEQAVEAAKGYLDSSSFSESGLVEQLEFEGFTQSQAEYGVSKAYR